MRKVTARVVSKTPSRTRYTHPNDQLSSLDTKVVTISLFHYDPDQEQRIYYDVREILLQKDNLNGNGDEGDTESTENTLFLLQNKDQLLRI